MKLNYLRKKCFIDSLKKNKIKINKKFFVNGYRDSLKKTVQNKTVNNTDISVLLVSSHLFAMYVIEACNQLNKKIGRERLSDSNILMNSRKPTR